MTNKLCTHWRKDNWCESTDVPKMTPGIRCPFANNDDEQRTFCKYYTYHGIPKERDGKYSIVINGKKIITGITGKDLEIIETLLEQTNYDI